MTLGTLCNFAAPSPECLQHDPRVMVLPQLTGILDPIVLQLDLGPAPQVASPVDVVDST